MLKKLLIVCAFTVLAAGCHSEPKNQQANKAPKEPPATGPWAGFGVGSSVQMESRTVVETNGHRSETVVDTKTTLVELTADKATLEEETNALGHTNTMRTDVLLKPPLEGVGQVLPGMEAPIIRRGTDTLTIRGQAVKCEFTETSSAANKTYEKVWAADEIPGRVAKKIQIAHGPSSVETTSEVTSFKAVK